MSTRARRSHRRRVGLRALIASLSLLVLVGSGLAWVTYQHFTASIPHGEAVPALLAGEHDPDGAAQNILLIGNDTRAGATRAEQKALHVGHDTTTVNADTMMVLHVPAGGGRPTIVSFPRDSWVAIPGHGNGKINSAYPDGYNAALAAHADERNAESAGIIEVIRTIHALTGLYVDHYMQVSLLGFYRISEAIGGVTVCLKAAQNKHTEVGDGAHGNSGIDLPKGVSVIEGEQALAFVRQRHGLPHGDLDRIKRQQYFLRSAFAKITQAGVLLNPFKLHDLLDAVGRSLLTDPTLDLIGLAQQLQSLTSGHIEFETLPNNGPQLIYPDGVETSIVAVDRPAIPAFVHQLEGHALSPLAKIAAAPASTVTLDVLNGAEVTRLAARNAALLRARGFGVDTVDSTPSPVQLTTIEYPAAQAAAAKALLSVVPKAAVVPTTAVRRVTLVLGTNGVVVTGLTSTGDPAARTAPGGAASSSTSATSASMAAPPAVAASASSGKPAKAAGGLGCID